MQSLTKEPFLVIKQSVEEWIFAGQYSECVEFVRKSRESGAFSKKTVSEWEILQNPSYAKENDLRSEIELRISNLRSSIDERRKMIELHPDDRWYHESRIVRHENYIEMLKDILDLGATKLLHHK